MDVFLEIQHHSNTSIGVRIEFPAVPEGEPGSLLQSELSVECKHLLHVIFIRREASSLRKSDTSLTAAGPEPAISLNRLFA
jgi:hypothetical protein